MKKRFTHFAFVSGYICLSLCLLTSTVCAEWSLTDDFNDGFLNSSIWHLNASVSNSVTEEGGALILDAMSDSFAHIEISNSWDYFTFMAKFKVSDVDSGSGLFAPGLFLYWGPGNWSSLQLDASARKIISYTSVSGVIVSNETLLIISYGEYYYLSIDYIKERDNTSTITIFKRASLREELNMSDPFTLEYNFNYFSGPPKKLILGKRIDNGFEEYNSSLERDNFSNTYIDDFRIRFGPEWYNDTAKYLIGKVHIAVLFVTRNNLTYPEYIKDNVKSNLDYGTKLLTMLAPSAANLSFSVSFHDSAISNESVLFCTDSCRGASVPDWCGSWRDDAVKNLGYSGPDEMAKTLRGFNGADHSIILYSVYSPDRYMNCGVGGYAEENYVVIPTFGSSNISGYYTTYPHEILHCFGAQDEYPVSCSLRGCIERMSPWYYTNGNCYVCNNTVPCMMNVEYGGEKTICPYTRGQIGWGDHDGDGLLDPVDPEMYVQCANSTTTTTTTVPTTTLPCSFTQSFNLSAGDNDVLFETPHDYPNEMNCYSGVYSCPKGYLGKVHVRYATEQYYDYLYVFNNYSGAYTMFSGNSSSYAWVDVPYAGKSDSEVVNITEVYVKFVSDKYFNSWGVQIDKIRCYQDSTICPIKGDHPPCGNVSLGEIIDAINLWAASSFDLNDVTRLIIAWSIS